MPHLRKCHTCATHFQESWKTQMLKIHPFSIDNSKLYQKNSLQQQEGWRWCDNGHELFLVWKVRHYLCTLLKRNWQFGNILSSQVFSSQQQDHNQSVHSAFGSQHNISTSPDSFLALIVSLLEGDLHKATGDFNHASTPILSDLIDLCTLHHQREFHSTQLLATTWIVFEIKRTHFKWCSVCFHQGPR